MPWLGLGLSSNGRSEDAPHPYRLLDAEPGLFDFVEYSAPLDVAQAGQEASLWPTMMERRASVPLLFHPVHLNLYGPALESKERLAQLAEHLLAVGSPWVGNDVGWWHAAGEPFPGFLYLAPSFDEGALELCVRHALSAQAALPVPLLLENPAVMAPRGPMHVLDFMNALHARTGLPLLLDLGHLYSHQLARGLEVDDGLDRFALDAVVEIHLAGGVVTSRAGRSLYVDDHSQPVREELFGLLERILPRCSALRAVTFEGDGHPQTIAPITLRRLRAMVPTRSPAHVAALPAPVGGAGPTPTAEQVASSWAHFDAVHRGEGEGAEAELELRLSVIAEQLDRRWPLSRILAAGTHERLRAFAASAELRSAFNDEGRTLDDAFSAYARRCAREEGDEGLTHALSLETWAQAMAPRRAGAAPEGGRLALAPGVGVASFPIDLRELLFAVRVVRRHLASRAWASGTLDASGLESVRQVARRPLNAPWVLALRRRGERVELIDLDPALAVVLRAAQRCVPFNDVPPADLSRAIALGLVALG